MQTTDTQQAMLDWTRRKCRRDAWASPAGQLIVITATLTIILLTNHNKIVGCHELKSTGDSYNVTTTTTTTTTSSRPTSHVESLAKLLQATDQRQRAVAAATGAAEQVARTTNSTDQQQQQQQQQQQSSYLSTLANKRISCDELSLVVLAQRVLNMSSASGTISRLIECKQDNLLDANLMDMFTAGPGLAPAAADQQPPVAGPRHSQPQQQPPATQTTPFMDHMETMTLEQSLSGAQPNQSLEVQRREQEEGGLHFGAKMAVSILVTIITLVAVATFVDYHLEPSKGNGEERRNYRRRSDFRSGKRTRAKRESGGGGYQAAKLRDYRSLSMSSNCSSNLFCSTSSVASSSVPILGATTNAGGSGGGERAPRHYETNLQLHFNQQSNCSSESGISADSAMTMISDNDGKHAEDGAMLEGESPPPSTHHHHQQQQPINMTTVREEEEEEEERAVRYGIVQERKRQEKTGGGNSLELARQVLLAFSLRQSARAIFEHSAPPPPTPTQAQQEEGKWKSFAESVRSQSARESVDSLHGLRFLSMIWVIVIHSYNFALRWMFFSNTNTLDGIYKSALSQLIANGSFACDSFFFAAGFLLPYLAYPAATSLPTTTTTTTTATTTTTTTATATNEKNEGPLRAGRAGPEVGERVPATCCCPTGARQPHGPPSGPPTCCCTCTCCSTAKTTAAATSENQQARRDTHTDEPRGSPQPPVVTIINMDPPPSSSSSLAACGAEPAARAAKKQQEEEEQDEGEGEDLKTTKNTQQFSGKQIVANICHRYARMMPLMMAIIGLCSTLLRYLGEGPLWQESTMMYDDWCRRNWWVNAMFLHNFVNRENMCLSHSWYSAVDFQLFLVGQFVLWTLNKSKRLGYLLLFVLLAGSPLLTMLLTLRDHLPAVPLVANVNEQTMNLYYGEIYIKPYSRASPYLVGMLLAYLLRTTRLAQWRPRKWQVLTGWTLALVTFAAILMAMQPAMNGRTPSELESALYSGWSRPLWACATGWMIFACMTNRGGFIGRLLSARLFVPLSRLTYPAFLIHPIVMALFYGSRASSFQFSHYLMLYLILGNIVITYASAFVLAALFELPLISIERILSKRIFAATRRRIRGRRRNGSWVATNKSTGSE